MHPARRLARRGIFDVHVVTWHELARHGVTIRGPRLEALEIPV